jgi:hypothetical protein
VKPILIFGGVLILAGLPLASAYAAGCVKGAAVGGVLGHVSGHHGVAGAAIGCAIGHHEAEKQDRYDHDRDARNDPR